MAYEFQPLGEVTEVRSIASDADVLIEEDGVIKRAPKALIGGGAYIININIIEADGAVTITCDDTITNIIDASKNMPVIAHMNVDSPDGSMTGVAVCIGSLESSSESTKQVTFTANYSFIIVGETDGTVDEWRYVG